MELPGEINPPVSRLESRRRRKAEWRHEKKQTLKCLKLQPAVKWSGFECTTFLDCGGISRVAPYAVSFFANCKHRWIGRSVVEVLAEEFNAYSREYFAEGAADGRLLINGVPFQPEYCFSAADSLEHMAHRHEPPVRTLTADHIIHKCLDMIVIDKPSSIPVHPCGRYQYNSVVYSLARNLDIDGAMPVHRLDRLTSGVLVMALNAETARSICSIIESRQVNKFYLARVSGEFPLKTNAEHDSFVEPTTPSCLAEIDNDVDDSSWVVSNDPIVCTSQKFSTFAVCPVSGKPCCTAFRRLNFNGNTSVVLCYPITGRTHQIRVHLQHLGFPIANDPCYGGKLCKGNTYLGLDDDDRLREFNKDILKNKVAKCPECNMSKDQFVPADPSSQGGLFCSEIWLHAISYTCSSWSFSTAPPRWATSSFNDTAYLQAVNHDNLQHL